MDRNDESLAFEEVANFVRGWARIPAKRQITPDTQFERDLGITGDDGSELLEAVQKRFRVNLAPDETGYRETFGLGPNEYLFNSEGFGFGAEIVTLLSNHSVRAFTVGELYRGLIKAQETNIKRGGSA